FVLARVRGPTTYPLPFPYTTLFRSGVVGEETLVTMHDVLDSMYQYDKEIDEKYLRKVVQPVESLLVNYPRIIVKDSCINYSRIVDRKSTRLNSSHVSISYAVFCLKK